MAGGAETSKKFFGGTIFHFKGGARLALQTRSASGSCRALIHHGEHREHKQRDGNSHGRKSVGNGSPNRKTFPTDSRSWLFRASSQQQLGDMGHSLWYFSGHEIHHRVDHFRLDAFPDERFRP